MTATTAMKAAPVTSPVSAAVGVGALSAYATDEERWRAVQRRDEAANGSFYYVVTTTGIYSRPSCVARLARRENVEFHTSLEEVRALGYRPCRRCHPDEPVLNRYCAEPVTGACLLMDGAVAPPNLDALARSAGYSRFHFHRMFKSLTGVTPYAYWSAGRARRVRGELLESRTVSDAIYRAGFTSNGQFYAASSAILGMTPQEFRAGGAGLVIRSAVGRVASGPVLVAVAEKGVCAVVAGGPREGAQALRARAAELFPHAEHRGGGPWFAALVGQVLARADLAVGGCDLLPDQVLRVCLQERIRQEFPTRTAPVEAPRAERLTGLDLRAC
ncbi:Ada metal-binding domain-containing protein [Streptomyces sp. NPDC087917]|uniref:bifunctional transcriptional activator/DNA repair enzyme AdaA n=1 Tax=unclassified Streptomyces TaxID=2593676 RepID=UPI00341F1FA1